MADIAPLKLPINLILLDGVGCLMLAFGAMEYFGEVDFLPASLGFEHRGIILMVVGVLLMLPFLLFVLSWVRSRTEAQLLK